MYTIMLSTAEKADLLDLLLMDITQNLGRITQVRKRYCLALQLAVALKLDSYIDVLLKYNVEDFDDPSWLMHAYKDGDFYKGFPKKGLPLENYSIQFQKMVKLYIVGKESLLAKPS